jgi:hypothetical protein
MKEKQICTETLKLSAKQTTTERSLQVLFTCVMRSAENPLALVEFRHEALGREQNRGSVAGAPVPAGEVHVDGGEVDGEPQGARAHAGSSSSRQDLDRNGYGHEQTRPLP